MTTCKVFLLALSLASGLPGQNVEGLYSGMARELPNGVCHNNECSWTVERLLTYYGVGLDEDGLKRGLRDRRPDVRSMAAEELAKTGAKGAIPSLADVLFSETVPGTRLYIANALAQLGDARGEGPLEGLCRSGGQSDPSAETRVRLMAAQFLQRLHKSASNSCAVALIRSLDRAGAPREFGLRAAALSLVTNFESPTQEQAAEVREIAGRWIADEDDNVRRQASAALASYGDTSSYQKIKAALAVERDSMTRDCMQRELLKMEVRLPRTPNR